MHSSVSRNPGRVLHIVRTRGSIKSYSLQSCQWQSFLLHPFPSLAPGQTQTSPFRSFSWERQERQISGRAKGVALRCEKPILALERKKEPFDASSGSKYLTQPPQWHFIKVSKQSRPVATISPFAQWKANIKAAGKITGKNGGNQESEPICLFYTQAFVD